MLFRLALAVLVAASVPARAEVTVRATWLELREPPVPTLSNLDPIPADLGLAGARVGLAENATTGRFLGQSFELSEIVVPPDGDWEVAADRALASSDLILAKAPSAALLALADRPGAGEAVIFNVAAEDEALRDGDCRPNLLHTIPSYGMRADALAQFLKSKRWSSWALISGTHPSDLSFADALRAAAVKFGLRIRDDLVWAFDADMRRNAAAEVPAFTQGLSGHDVVVVADEVGDFGRYVLFNAWEPRPVAGSEGLTVPGWSPAIENWGAAQLQKRFRDAARRPMKSVDYAAWAAMRAIGEAVTRTGATNAAALREYLLSDAFELAGFKGHPLSFRTWNGQLRQPIPLAHPRAMVAMAPIEGFLHASDELDTLGPDAPQSVCEAFQ